MIKIFDKTNDYLLKTYDPIEAYKYIISNPHHIFNIILNGDLVNYDVFLKYFLQEEKNYFEYLQIYRSFYQSISLNQYIDEI